jgi:hypothetical protein
MGEPMSGRAANDHCGTGLVAKGERHMTNRCKSALLMVSLAVVAGVSAPAADALPSCQDSGTTSTCQTNGSVSIKARPGTVAAPANQPVIRWGRRR